MQEDNLVLSLALFAVVISAIGLGFNYYTQQGVTGLATYTDTGKVNITISTNLQIRFQTDHKLIEWGSGYVNTTNNNLFAILYTADNTVINGTWTSTSNAFVVENSGNINCSLWLMAGDTAQAFLGGTNPSYQYNVTNNETNSCTAASGFTLGALQDVNDTETKGTKVCDDFTYNDSRDEIRIDIRLVVPSDSKTGTLTDTVTATGETA